MLLLLCHTTGPFATEILNAEANEEKLVVIWNSTHGAQEYWISIFNEGEENKVIRTKFGSNDTRAEFNLSENKLLSGQAYDIVITALGENKLETACPQKRVLIGKVKSIMFFII